MNINRYSILHRHTGPTCMRALSKGIFILNYLADSSDIVHVYLCISRYRIEISKRIKKEKENRKYPYQKKYHFPVEVFCTLNKQLRANPWENDTDYTDLNISNPPCVAILSTFSRSVFVPPQNALNQRVFMRNCARAQARMCTCWSSAQ